MIEPINELDEAALRVEMRELYRDVGQYGCLQALYEILKSAEILSEIVLEEHEKEKRL